MNSGANAFACGTVAVVLTLCGCSPRDRNAADTATSKAGAAVDTAAGRVAAAADTTAQRTDSAAATAKRGGWTDASVLGFIGANNAGAVRVSQLAEKKATNPAVKKFAQQLVSEHRALALEMRSLAQKLSVTPDTADGDVHKVMDKARDQIKDLTDKSAGVDWDKKYIDDQIDDHKDMLDKLQDAAKNTNSAELRAAIEKASGKVQEHLTKAQNIKENDLKS